MGAAWVRLGGGGYGARWIAGQRVCVSDLTVRCSAFMIAAEPKADCGWEAVQGNGLAVRRGASRTRSKRLAGLVVLALGVVLAFQLALAGGAAADLSWSPLAPTDRHEPFSDRGSLSAVACPTESLCVAADSGGLLFTSSDPESEPSWRLNALVEGGSPIDPLISCPSSSFCVAADEFGVIRTSTSPDSGSWTSADIADSYLSGISCPSASRCVAIDELGGVVTTDDPDGPASGWTSYRSGFSSLGALACPTESLCVAYAGNGSIVYSTDPGTAGSWSTAAAISNDDPVEAMSCPSASFCAAVDFDGNVYTSSNPSSGAWSAPVSSGLAVRSRDGLTCRSSSFCVAAESDDEVAVTTDPEGGSGAWGRIVEHGHSFDGVSCPSTSLCALIDGNSDVYFLSNPGVSETFTSVGVDGYDSMLDLSCASSSFCAALDDAGDVVTSNSPLQGANTWTATPIGLQLTHLECPSASLCVGLEDLGDVVTSADPTGGVGAWSAANVDGINKLTGLSCPATDFCAAVDNAGNVLTSNDPAGGGGWSTTSLGQQSLSAISCPSAAFCVAADASGNVDVSSDPMGGSSAWVRFNVDGTTPIDAISCPSTTLCAAVDAGGGILASTTPAGGAGAWSVEIGGSYNPYDMVPEAISCPAVSLCVATDSYYGVRESTDPAGGGSTWHSESITPSFPAVYLGLMTAVACPSAQSCIVADNEGNAAVGTRPPPPGNTSPPMISGTASEGQTLTETHGSWTNSPDAFSYQWLRCGGAGDCEPVPGATGQTYQLRPADVGYEIRVREVASNDGGPSAPAESAPTAPVDRVPPGAPSTAEIRQALRSGIVPRHRTLIGALLRTGRVRLRVRAWSAGVERIRWYAHSSRNPHTETLIASATISFSAAGVRAVWVRLKPAGKSLLHSSARVSVLALGSFTASGRPPVKTSASFTLRRS